MMKLLSIAIQLVVILFAIVIHETSHGYVAYLLGDPTAKRSGRLTLNPIYHIDPVGTIILPIFLVLLNMPVFGWAKPVPVNPTYFKNWRRDMMLTAIAGPGSNILVATVSALILLFIKSLSPASIIYAFRFLRYGGKLPPLSFLVLIFVFSFMLNLYLAIFNLIPIPPLDGSKILAWMLPRSLLPSYYNLERYGFLILMGFIFLDSYIGILRLLASPVNYLLIKILS